MLSTHPTMINSVSIPFMSNWQTSYETNRKTYTRQSGTETDIILRQRQLTIQASTKCLWDEVSQFLAYQNQPTLTVSLWNPSTNAYIDHTMRMENFAYSLVKDSEELSAVDGIYNMSFTLREF